jgi:tRNA G10  N-methylase Trm11
MGVSVDFRVMPFDSDMFDVVAFDPPYKLNGTATIAVDGRYGVHEKATRTQRHRLMCSGLIECGRVAAKGGLVLAKCQDQVEGGKMRWQTEMLSDVGKWAGLTKIDRFHMPSYRSQPDGVTQQHARNNFSTLIVFRKDER